VKQKRVVGLLNRGRVINGIPFQKGELLIDAHVPEHVTVDKLRLVLLQANVDFEEAPGPARPLQPPRRRGRPRKQPKTE